MLHSIVHFTVASIPLYIEQGFDDGNRVTFFARLCVLRMRARHTRTCALQMYTHRHSCTYRTMISG